jgi:hypothetical protein
VRPSSDIPELMPLPQVPGKSDCAVCATATLLTWLTGYWVRSCVPIVEGKVACANAVNCGSSKVTLLVLAAEARSGSMAKKKKPQCLRGTTGPPIVAEMLLL